MEAPLAPVCCVGEIISAEDNILSPEDPVSSRMPPIVWQLVVLPGTQTVTLVNAPLT
jgi:ABC-type cobalamin transport system permease subunit